MGKVVKMKKPSRKRKPARKVPALITLDLGKAIHKFVEKKTPKSKTPKLCIYPLIRG
jgi:hypothetical protein